MGQGKKRLVYTWGLRKSILGGCIGGFVYVVGGGFAGGGFIEKFEMRIVRIVLWIGRGV